MKIEAKLDEAIKAELERLELLLMEPAVRRNREHVGALMARDFVEFGSSGRVWTREATLELLATETYTPPQVENFAFRLLGPGVALVTYRTLRNDAAGERTVTLRSSIWTWESERWKICFHQGTRAS
ncbi:MAG TPA: DUF4440 domain-containing protein [Terracidiphilus sp.]|nr:DUF4440 domain-containing protein [Terracidiphilus sp.]